AAQRLQSAAGVPARVRREGRDHRVRPPGHPDAAGRVPRPVRDPAPVPDPPAAAAGQAQPARDLCPRPTHVPVLRPADPRPDARPHRAAPSGRRPHVGEPRHRLQGVQPPQGRQDARGGALPAASRAVRAAQRRVLDVHAVPGRRPQRGLADLPLPGTELSDPDDLRGGIPEPVHDLLRTLWGAGHAAYVVGGALRDALLGRSTTNWDLATAALPEQTAAIFPDASYENRFGTVVLQRSGLDYEITTFRTDHDYADFRRPHRVEFGASLEADLARRDFTMNALAWGAPDAATAPRLVDPHDGRADIAARRIRAVGEPDRRFVEDALRMLRAVRFSATLGFEIEPATLTAIRDRAPLVAHLSGERIAVELDRILAAPRPSEGLRLLASTGILEHVSPDLAAQRGVAQNKVEGEDLWDHTARTVDAAAAGGAGSSRPAVRLAALVHDIGKPATAADGHFY